MDTIEDLNFYMTENTEEIALVTDAIVMKRIMKTEEKDKQKHIQIFRYNKYYLGNMRTIKLVVTL